MLAAEEFAWGDLAVTLNLMLPNLVAIPVIFQPELRRALEQLGQTSRYFRVFRRDTEQPSVLAFQEASLRLSQRRHGALVVFEQETGLQEYVVRVANVMHCRNP